MKDIKNWKVVNYLGVDVLMHEKSPKCIIARTTQSVRATLVSLKREHQSYYLLHNLEEKPIALGEQNQIIKEAIDSWRSIEASFKEAA